MQAQDECDLFAALHVARKIEKELAAGLGFHRRPLLYDQGQDNWRRDNVAEVETGRLRLPGTLAEFLWRIAESLRSRTWQSD